MRVLVRSRQDVNLGGNIAVFTKESDEANKSLLSNFLVRDSSTEGLKVVVGTPSAHCDLPLPQTRPHFRHCGRAWLEDEIEPITPEPISDWPPLVTDRRMLGKEVASQTLEGRRAAVCHGTIVVVGLTKCYSAGDDSTRTSIHAHPRSVATRNG
jgi:hypothetical protein